MMNILDSLARTIPSHRPNVVSPTSGIYLDVTNYDVKVPPEYKVDGPNSIHVLMGTDRKYKTKWLGPRQRYELSRRTLESLPGSKPFSGFNPGDTAMVAIGFDHTGVNPSKDNTLSTMWLGLINVNSK